jgi:hypothetical protein
VVPAARSADVLDATLFVSLEKALFLAPTRALVGLRAPGTFSADDSGASMVLGDDFRAEFLAGDHGFHAPREEIDPLLSLAAIHTLAKFGVSVDAVATYGRRIVLSARYGAAPVQGDYLASGEAYQPPHRYLLVRHLPGPLVFHLVRTYAAQQLDPFLAYVADHPCGSLSCVRASSD